MGKSGRRSSGAFKRVSGGTVLASRSWRARVALALLLRELRLIAERGIAEPGGDATPRSKGRVRRIVERLEAALGLEDRRPATGTAPARSPDPASTLPRRPIGEQGRARDAASIAKRAEAEAEMRDVDALLANLEVDARELETALRVVRRVRSLVGATDEHQGRADRAARTSDR